MDSRSMLTPMQRTTQAPLNQACRLGLEGGLRLLKHTPSCRPSARTVFRLVSPAYRAWWEASPSRSGLLSSGCTAHRRGSMAGGRQVGGQAAAGSAEQQGMQAGSCRQHRMQTFPFSMRPARAARPSTHLPAWARPAAAAAFPHPGPRPARAQRTARKRPASHAARRRQPSGGGAPAPGPRLGWPAHGGPMGACCVCDWLQATHAA